jgi:hypothetical protein
LLLLRKSKRKQEPPCTAEKAPPLAKKIWNLEARNPGLLLVCFATLHRGGLDHHPLHPERQASDDCCLSGAF